MNNYTEEELLREIAFWWDAYEAYDDSDLPPEEWYIVIKYILSPLAGEIRARRDNERTTTIKSLAREGRGL